MVTEKRKKVGVQEKNGEENKQKMDRFLFFVRCFEVLFICVISVLAYKINAHTDTSTQAQLLTSITSLAYDDDTRKQDFAAKTLAKLIQEKKLDRVFWSIADDIIKTFDDRIEYLDNATRQSILYFFDKKIVDGGNIVNQRMYTELKSPQLSFDTARGVPMKVYEEYARLPNNRDKQILLWFSSLTAEQRNAVAEKVAGGENHPDIQEKSQAKVQDELGDHF